MLSTTTTAIINNIAALGLPPHQCARVLAAVLEPLIAPEQAKVTAKTARRGRPSVPPSQATNGALLARRARHAASAHKRRAAALS